MIFERFGNLLMRIHEFRYVKGGGYSVFIPCDYEGGNENYQLKVDTPCKVLFVTREQVDSGHPYAVKHRLCEIFHIEQLQEIVKAALQSRLNCTEEDFVKAINFYSDNDAFYDFTKDS